MRDDPAVTALVTRAANGDKQAWDTLVERYAPLIWSICRSHRLGGADAGDVGQRVWLQLADHLDKIGDPAALPGWLATTTRRECARVQRAARGAHAAGHPPDAQTIPGHQAQTVEQQLLAAERHAALREALARLPPLLPAADHPAHPGPARAIRHDQRQAEHPGRQHRAEPRPLPGQAPPRPGRHSTDQRRGRNAGSETAGQAGPASRRAANGLLGDDHVRTSSPPGTSPADGST
jgi:RNA polymerase sigma factor (sigma-70 family)